VKATATTEKAAAAVLCGCTSCCYSGFPNHTGSQVCLGVCTLVQLTEGQVNSLLTISCYEELKIE